MAKPFPDHVAFHGYYEPLGAEVDAPDLIIEGDLPAGLSGTFYRNGPEPVFAPRAGDTYHPFDGDGMIYAVHLHDGSASLRNRWVRTEKYNQERAAGERLFGVLGNPMFNDPRVNPADYNTANTHIWPHGDRLYALMEGAPAVRIDPHSLETIGTDTFEGSAAGPFTAHPKHDADTGNMYAFGYQATGVGSTAIRYNVFDAASRPVKTTQLDQPYCSLLHDFMITGSKAVWPVMPLTIDIQRMMRGGPVTAWDGALPAHFGIMARDGDASDIRWIETDPLFMYHSANAYDDGDKVVVEVAGANQPPLMVNADGSRPAPADTKFTLRRWTLDPVHGFKNETLDDLELHFPRVDDRFTGKKYRYVYANASAELNGRLDGFGCIATYDLVTGKRSLFDGGPGVHFGEPVFAPRASTAAEGDGYLLVMRSFLDRRPSELLVFSAPDPAAGPIATVRLPVRVPAGFHCSWRQQLS